MTAHSSPPPPRRSGARERRDREERALLARIVDTSEDAIIATSLGGVVLTWNDSAARLYGHSASEAIGRPVSMLLPPGIEDEVPPLLAAIARGQRVGQHEMVRSRKDGTLVNVSVAISPIRDARGRITGAAIIARDVSERHLLEAAVRASEMRVRSLFETARNALVVIDRSGSITGWNRRAEDVFGWTADEARGRNLATTLIPARFRTVHQEGVERFAATGAGPAVCRTIRAVALHRDGHELPVELSVWRLDDEGGGHFGAFIEDISERKRGEAKFRGLLEAATDAIVGVDIEGRIALVNSQAERLFRYRRDELVGQQVELLVPEPARAVHPGHRARYFTAPGVRSMGGAGLGLTGRRKDGSEFPAEISLSALETEEGLLVSAAIRDVSERVRTELEAKLAREEAEQANQAKSEFLSRMSHELRTPLNGILGFAQLLALDELGPAQRESVTHILRGGRHLLDLIDELLDLSRIESGNLTLSLEPVPVFDVVREALDLVRPMSTEQRVTVWVDPDAPPDMWVVADRQRLKQVLLNLASNAIKYNRPGGQCSLSWSARSDRRMRLTVSDTGIGIRPELMERLFVPFERLDPRIGVGGTGLGLALSRRLLASMGGDIGVDSRIGEGSTFWVELAEADGALTPVLQPEEIQRPSRRRRAVRILYIEDNLSNLRLVEQILSRWYDVRMIPTQEGRAALDLARQHRPELVLLDLHLPDMPGSEVLRLLRSDPATQNLPVIVVSADATTGSIARLTAGGALGYVTKPIDVSRFLGLINEALAG